MVNWEWEVKIYDTSADKWLSGLDQELMSPITFTRAITDSIGSFNFEYDVEDTSIGPEDVVVINIGHRGSSVLKQFVGRVEKASEEGETIDRHYSIAGRDISKILLGNDAPDEEYSEVGQAVLINHIVSNIRFDYNSAREWVSNEPVYVTQYDQWLDLVGHEIVSGTWTLRHGGVTKSYGTDYEIDLSVDPPLGRIKILSTGTIKRGNYAYAEYQTDWPLPYGRLMGGYRRYEIATSSVFNETDTLTINLAGVTMFDALSDACLEADLKYDFYLSPDLDLRTQGKGSGQMYTYEWDDVTELGVYDDSSFILNDTRVENAGGLDTVHWPDPDEYTEFTGDPATEYWSAGGATHGVFDCDVRFSDTSAEAVAYGGRFLDDWDVTPGISSVITGRKVGSNYLQVEEDTAFLRSMKAWRGFTPPTDELSNINIRNTMHFFEFGVPGYDDVNGRIDAHTTDDERYYRTWDITSRNIFANSDTILTGGWGTAGSPQWNSIDKIAFTAYTDSSTNMLLSLDGWFFGTAPVFAVASDVASQQAYGRIRTNGIIQYPVVDNTIKTYLEAQQRANSIIELYKDPIPMIDNVLFEEGNLDITVGDQLRIETKTDGIYYPTTRIASITHTIEDDDLSTVVECRASTPVGIESYMVELETEIRRLEMREQ